MSMQEMSVEELQGRVALGDVLIQGLQNDPDPRAGEAEAEIKRQQQEIREEIARREGKPPPVVIQMETGTLNAVFGDKE